jgi:hypothetical protein
MDAMVNELLFDLRSVSLKWIVKDSLRELDTGQVNK